MGLPDEIENNFPNMLTFQQVKSHGTNKGYTEIVGIQEENDDQIIHIPPKNLEEYVLWGKFKEGDEDAFTLIYNKYIFHLFNYGERITTNKELIEDSIHDLFVDIWKNRESIGHAYSIKFYLYKGLKRKIIKNLEINKRLQMDHFSDSHDLEMTFSHEFDLIMKEVSVEQKANLLRAINSLSKRQKEAIILRFYDDLSFQEIGELLSINVKSTYTLIYRAIDVLKQNFPKIIILLVYGYSL